MDIHILVIILILLIILLFFREDFINIKFIIWFIFNYYSCLILYTLMRKYHIQCTSCLFIFSSSNRKEKLLLTPVTYIEIISVREVKSNGEPIQQMFKDDSLTESLYNNPVLGLFSDLDDANSKGVTQFHSRV
jgi:hypothetical protein